MRRSLLLAVLACGALVPAVGAQQRAFTHADTLRGSITPQRAWWDVLFYDLDVRIQPSDRSISGSDRITYRVVSPATEMQIDLQQPLVVDSIVQDGRQLAHRRDGNAFFVTIGTPQPVGSTQRVAVFYHGIPRAAKNAPWDGGFVWKTDGLGRPWIATAVQGLGASAWWPNKDTQADEPDSLRLAVTLPDPLVDVSNGRLRGTTHNADGTSTFTWFVQNPINNYDVAISAGDYRHFGETYQGESGALTLDFWPLASHEAAARLQFAQVRPMLACFEHWFGPYPWYADGYKLVEAPHLGMEHQSAVAYGNNFMNGYLGRDLSGTGEGLKWDFIIVHESAHEWFGNSLTSADIADMWVHESFANYAENLYTECQSGKAAGARYVIGTRPRVRNDRPIVGAFGVQDEGSSDMYDKGGNMLHTIRQLVHDDERWRGILRGLGTTFGHTVVTGTRVQQYISAQAGMDLSRVFAQYLTTTMIPSLEYAVVDSAVAYRWTNVVPGFDMPVRVSLGSGDSRLLRPTTAWQWERLPVAAPVELHVDENFFVTARAVAPPR